MNIKQAVAHIAPLSKTCRITYSAVITCSDKFELAIGCDNSAGHQGTYDTAQLAIAVKNDLDISKLTVVEYIAYDINTHNPSIAHLQIPASELAKAIEQVGKSVAGKKELRSYLQCFLLECNGLGKITLVASTGNVLSVYELNAASEEPQAQAQVRLVLNALAIKALVKLCKQQATESINVTLHDDFISFAVPQWHMSIKSEDAKYPDFSPIFSKDCLPLGIDKLPTLQQCNIGIAESLIAGERSWIKAYADDDFLALDTKLVQAMHKLALKIDSVSYMSDYTGLIINAGALVHVIMAINNPKRAKVQGKGK